MILVSTTTCGLSLRNDIPMRANGPIRARETRSEEHTSELQSQSNLVCRLLLEKKKKKHDTDAVELAETEPYCGYRGHWQAPDPRRTDGAWDFMPPRQHSPGNPPDAG